MESTHGRFKRVIVVKEATKYLLTDLKPDLEYTVKVQSYTAAGSSPQKVQKSAKTDKKPTVTGMSTVSRVHLLFKYKLSKQITRFVSKIMLSELAKSNIIYTQLRNSSAILKQEFSP